MSSKGGSNAWVMLFLLMMISFVTYAQQFCTPVLLPLIGNDLGLNTVQLGFIWGMATFGGLFLSVPGGLLGDRVGPKWGIFILSLVVVIAFGLRGLAKEAVSLSVMMFVGGGIIGALPSIATKAIFIWFSPERVGSISGVWWSFSRVGMAVGAAISVTIIEPMVNGWQNTFFLYGSILLVLALIWLLIIKEPAGIVPTAGAPFGESIKRVARSRDVWLCSITLFGVIGSFVGFVGYLPLYLQNNGWTEVSSSLSITVFILITVVTTFAIPYLSDKYRLRKLFFTVPLVIYILVIGLMAPLKVGPITWPLVIIGGLSFGGLMPVINAMIGEIKGIGTRYAGTAISLGSGLGGLGGLLFAWISGILATVNEVIPLLFTAGLCLLCLLPFFFTTETGSGRSKDIREQNDQNGKITAVRS